MLKTCTLYFSRGVPCLVTRILPIIMMQYLQTMYIYIYIYMLTLQQWFVNRLPTYCSTGRDFTASNDFVFIHIYLRFITNILYVICFCCCCCCIMYYRCSMTNMSCCTGSFLSASHRATSGALSYKHGNVFRRTAVPYGAFCSQPQDCPHLRGLYHTKPTINTSCRAFSLQPQECPHQTNT